MIGHWIAKTLLERPKTEILYFAHQAEFAHAVSRGFRVIALEAGVKLARDFNTIKEWRTDQGGGVFSCSADQDVVGRGFDYVIVDDPIGNPQDADDPIIRQKVDTKIRFLTTRLHPGGRVLINMSRFHPDDPIGRRERETDQGWVHIKLPAILDDGTALWPERYSLDEIRKLRDELRIDDPAERIWWAQYMGDPRPESGELFRAPQRYAELPQEPIFRTAIGIDAAYSTAKGADWFAVAVGTAFGARLYLREVTRFRASEETVLQHLRATRDVYGAAPIWTYMSGPEIGTARYLTQMGVPVNVMGARFHKVTRSRKTIDRWNSGSLLVPNNAPWMPGFLSRVLAWRGIDGDQDDEIDALVSLHDGVMTSGVTKPRTLAARRM